MLFILEELFMLSIIMLSLVFMSVEKSIWKHIHKLMIYFSILLFIILYEGYISNEIIVFLWKYNLKFDYFAIILKGLVFIYLLNYNILVEKMTIVEKLFIKEYIVLIWLAIMASCFIIMANELFIIYLALELQNLILYVLTNLRRKVSVAIESGIKYYIMGSFSSCILLYGLVMLFGVFGTLDLLEISYLLGGSLFDNIISIWYIFFLLLLILIGLLFKLGVAPFHWWVAEVYGGSLSSVVLYFTIVPKVSLIVILIKYYNLVLVYFAYFFSNIFFFFSLCSLIIGFFFSLYEKNIIKFLAYSGIFNNGFFMAVFSNGTQLSFVSLLYFFIPYMFILLGIFFILLNVRKLNREKLVSIYDFALLGKNNIVLAAGLALLFLSLAGIPPLSGFFGKFFIFFALVLNKYWLLFLVLVIFSIAASFYYFRVLRLMFFSQDLSYVFLQLLIHPSFLAFYILFSIYFIFFYDYIYMYFFFFVIQNMII